MPPLIPSLQLTVEPTPSGGARVLVELPHAEHYVHALVAASDLIDEALAGYFAEQVQDGSHAAGGPPPGGAACALDPRLILEPTTLH